MTLSTTPLQLARSRGFVLNSPAMELRQGEILSILGPNGAGKSTFLQLLAGQLTPDEGSVQWEEQTRSALGRREWAKHVAFVAQEAGAAPALRLGQYVRMGRVPFRGLFQPFTAQDEAAVNSAIELCGLAAYEDAWLQQLSGGQRQRARIARALAQEPGVLLLDEPTNHLDLAVMRNTAHLLRNLADSGVALVISVHDLDFAAVLSDWAVILQQGRVQAVGPTAQTLTAESIRDYWGVEVISLSHGEKHRHILDYQIPPDGVSPF